MTLRTPPPPVLTSARVVAYAYVDDLPYNEVGRTLRRGHAH